MAGVIRPGFEINRVIEGRGLGNPSRLQISAPPILVLGGEQKQGWGAVGKMLMKGLKHLTEFRKLKAVISKFNILYRSLLFLFCANVLVSISFKTCL